MQSDSTPNAPNDSSRHRLSLPMHLRELLEVIVIISFGLGIWSLALWLGPSVVPYCIWTVVLCAVMKTFYYFAESLWQLVRATAEDMPYHRFLMIMAYNMAEVTISFSVDFCLLQLLAPGSLSGMESDTNIGFILFDCFYFSVLNFSFFGYGDITPTTIPAKIVMLLEVITAFTTVIFLISDFVSMKDSMRRQRRD